VDKVGTNLMRLCVGVATLAFALHIEKFRANETESSMWTQAMNQDAVDEPWLTQDPTRPY
jgi:hypothetical protein